MFNTIPNSSYPAASHIFRSKQYSSTAVSVCYVSMITMRLC